MASGDDELTPRNPAAEALAKAAQAVGPLGWLRAMDGGAWLDRCVKVLRHDLGPLSAQVAPMLDRAGRLLDASSPAVLLYRAPPRRPDRRFPLYAFIDAYTASDARGEPVLVSSALHEALAPVDRGAIDALESLMADRRRLDLPSLLEDLKDDVRADRLQGFATVRHTLRWLLEADDGRPWSAAYQLFDALTDILGESGLRELQRQRRIRGVLAARAEGGTPAWWEALCSCFAEIGHPLSARVSVIPCGPEHRIELAVLDHGRGRIFEIRQGSGTLADGPWHGATIHGPEAGRAYVPAGVPFSAPLRVHDAAQGMATWAVDRRLVQESPVLYAPGTPALQPWDIGGRRAAVAVFFVHYRDSDAGEYFELGLGTFVAPEDDPLAVGLVTLGSMPVSTQRATDIGRDVWGFPKEHVPAGDWEVHYRADHLECVVKLSVARVRLRMPRSAIGLVSAMPVPSYTRKPAVDRGTWHRSMLMRFARGESLRVAGGSVELSVEPLGPRAFAHPLVGELQRLGLIDSSGLQRSNAMHAVWSEHVSGNLGPPLPLPAPEPVGD